MEPSSRKPSYTMASKSEDDHGPSQDCIKLFLGATGDSQGSIHPLGEASQSLMEDGGVLGSFHSSLHRLGWEENILPPGLSGRVSPSLQHPSLFCCYAFCVYWKDSAFSHCLQCLASTRPLSHATASRVSRCYLGICLPTLELGSPVPGRVLLGTFPLGFSSSSLFLP